MRAILIGSLSLGLLTAFVPTAAADDATGTIILPFYQECQTITTVPGAEFTLTGTNVAGEEADFDLFFSDGSTFDDFGAEAGNVPAGATSADVCLYSALHVGVGAAIVPGPATYVYDEA